MSSPSTPQGGPVSPERARRILPIAANLLPVEIVESRRGRKTRRVVVVGLGAFLALLTGWYGVATYQTSTARSGLVAAEDDVSRLQAQQNTYGNVVGAQAESQGINTALSALLASDLQWSKLLADLRGAASSEVSVTGFTAALSQNTGTGPKSAQLPEVSGKKPVGTVTVTGLARTKSAVAGYVDALGGVPGVLSVLVTTTTQGDDGVEFSAQVFLRDSVLGGRYAPKTTAVK